MSRPTRLLLELPPQEDLYTPRAGRLRIGETYSSPTTDRPDRMLPRRLDYFRVDGEDGITSATAAASFHEVFPGEPKAIDVELPADEPDHVLRGAWRKYAGSKMVIECNGSLCNQKTQSGVWLEPAPCACDRQRLSPDHKDHCTRVFSLELLIPKVEAFGIWDIGTTSEISVNQLTSSLRFIRRMAGRLSNLPLQLVLKPVKVSPKGVTSTVQTLDLILTGISMGDVLDGKIPARTRVVPPALPAPLDEGKPDPLLITERTEEGGDDAGEASPPDATEGESTKQATMVVDPALKNLVAARLRGLSANEKARLRALCDEFEIKPTRDGLIAAFGDKAVDEIDHMTKEIPHGEGH